MGIGKTVHRDVDRFASADQIQLDVPGATLCLLPGTDINLARRNFATANKLPVVGAPTVEPRYIIGNGGVNYLRSGITVPSIFTISAILKRDDTNAADATRGAVAADFGGASAMGRLLISWSSATALRCRVFQSDGATKDASLVPTNPTALHRFTWIVTLTSVTAINETDGGFVTTPLTAPLGAVVFPMSLMSANVTTYAGWQGLGYFGMWPRALTPDERIANWAQVNRYNERNGIVVA